MDYLKPQRLDALAAEYVLGTLSRAARARMARLARGNETVATALRSWENRLLPLSESLPSVSPPERVWPAILGRIQDRRKDDNGNNILMSAAQMCGPRIVTALIAAGAEIKLTNGSGMTPLGMALLMKHPDAAEVLVSKGARLNASQAQMLNASVTDPRAKAMIQRAAGK
jgi:anti-sigma-K factor RskA